VALVLDTSVLFAALDADDPDHERCAGLLADSEELLVIPFAVFPELDYWVRKVATADAWLSFCEDVREGAYALHQADAEMLLAAARLQARYADLGLDVVDAMVFVTCEALGEAKVATLDHRDFGVLRTQDGRQLAIVP
jgi:uncharacterized protein